MRRRRSSFSPAYQLSGNEQSDFAFKNVCLLSGGGAEADPAAAAAEEPPPPVSMAPQGWKLRFPACTAPAAAAGRRAWPPPARPGSGVL